jgi:D-alanyl-D-alanine endopeptidase (penicillin-binding protein 7)
MRKLAVTVVSAFFVGLLSQPAIALELSANAPRLESNAAIVIDQEQGSALYAKNARAVMPIASITKLMTAIVVLDARLPLDEPLEVTHEDLDFVKGTRSRLGTGTVLTRREMLKLALMASENRAASALGRHYPGGFPAFVSAMNRKARELGMRDTRFVDSTGLNPDNVSTAQDLVRLVEAGLRYPVIRDFTTSESHYVEVDEGRRSKVLSYNNSNGLVRARNWDIGLSKTGYISEAGRCLVMQAQIAAKPVIIVLLDSWGKMSRIADANRIRHWLEGETRVREPRTVRVRNQAAPRASKLGRNIRQETRRVNTRRA